MITDSRKRIIKISAYEIIHTRRRSKVYVLPHKEVTKIAVALSR